MKITSIGYKKYLLGTELWGIHPATDFPSSGTGFHLSHVSKRYSPVVIFNDGNTAYAFKAEAAVKSRVLMNTISVEDRAEVERVASTNFKKPDYLSWVFREEVA